VARRPKYVLDLRLWVQQREIRLELARIPPADLPSCL
jgi:hypothetical protein